MECRHLLAPAAAGLLAMAGARASAATLVQTPTPGAGLCKLRPGLRAVTWGMALRMPPLAPFRPRLLQELRGYYRKYQPKTYLFPSSFKTRKAPK